MNNLKKLLIPSVVILLLLIVVIVWAVAKPGNTVEESERTNFDVITVPMHEISSMEIVKSEGVNNVISITSDEAVGQLFTLESLDADADVIYSQSSLGSYVGVLSSFAATTEVKNPTDLSEYGLDNPSYTIVINKVDGSVVRIMLGNKTYDNSGCFFMVEGIEGVYITASIKLSYCAYTSINFLDTQLLNINYSEISTVKFVRNYINNPNESITLEATCDISQDSGDPLYQVFSPFSIQASAYFENLVEYFATLEISEYRDLTDEEVIQYGLDNPTYSMIFTMDNGQVITIKLSSSIDGFYYGFCSEIDCYFMISEFQMVGLDTPVLTLLNSYVSYYSASSITRIIAEYGDDSFTFDLDVQQGFSISDSSSTADLNMRSAKVFNSNNRSYAAILYETIACIEIGGIDATATPEYIPVLTITFNTRNYETRVVDFVQRDATSYYVFFDGQFTSFYVYEGELFGDGGQDTFAYGVWPAYELAQTAIDNQTNGVYDIPVDSEN